MITKLLKYEFLRRKNTLLAFAIILAVAECLIIFGLYKGDGWLALSIILSVLIIGTTYFCALLDTIWSYFSDLKNKHGYMLFLTPNSGYKIIGSKALFGLVELFISVAVVFILTAINLTVAKGIYAPESTELHNMIIQLKVNFKDLIPSLWQIIQFVLMTLLQWFNIIMMGIFAITLSKTVFSTGKHRFLLSLMFFILLSIVVQFITVSVMTPFGLFGDMIKIEMSNNVPIAASLHMNKYFLIGSVLYVIYITLFYFFSGRLLHKRIDL